MMNINTLQKEYDSFVQEESPETWEWYETIRRYTDVLATLKGRALKNTYASYQDLNYDFRNLLNDNNEDFLQRYLFESNNGFSTIRNQLIKIEQRDTIRNKANSNFEALKAILVCNDKQTAMSLTHDFIEGNNWSVIYRFLRALFPNDFTAVDAPNKFDKLVRKLNKEFHITLKSVNQIDSNKDILDHIRFEDIYIAQIFFWIYIEDNSAENESKLYDMEPLDIYPLNQILFGAPGTGKTYHTKKVAVEIIDNKIYNGVNRDFVLERFEQLKNNGQIHFTTFHQSISYEDFIEGIKPVKMPDGSITYEVKDGIFKSICVAATSKNLYNRLFAIGEKFEKWQVTEISSQIVGFQKPKGGVLLLPLKLFDDLYRFIVDLKIDFKNGRIDKNLEVDREEYPFLEKYLVNGYETLHKNIYTAYLNLSSHVENKDKYVLIIDEINRGNVSAIFGELITLLEEDKRKGVLRENMEFIEAQLPYSNKMFSVPDNLYIIGTMNTADRSVEALDTALRRRFSFIEMKSEPELLFTEHPSNGIISVGEGEINLMKLLEAINKRIEVLLDKDHQIGHSYFIKVKSFPELQSVFKNKITPLLEEYFYGDFGKIGLVLGESFITPKNMKKEDVFAKFDSYEDRSFLTEKSIYTIKDPGELLPDSFTSIYA